MHLFKIILLSLVALYLCTIAILYCTQRSLMYHPDKEKNSLASFNIKNAEEITLTTDDNIKLQAWFRPSNKNHNMVIFLHGNAGNLEDRVEHLKALTDMDYGFIIPAWRSFGKSQGNPSLKGLYLDAKSAIDYLTNHGYSLANTIIIGESLGTGIATEMALRYKFKGLFLITPYTSVADRADEIYPYMFAKQLTKDNFKILDKIADINQPLLIIHGDSDNMVPYSHSQIIFAAAKDPKKFILYPNINHTNYNKCEVFLEMDKFFSNY